MHVVLRPLAGLGLKHRGKCTVHSMNRLGHQLASHYGNVREVYDSAPFYAPGPYEEWLASACIERLKLTASHKLADVGGGSGSFAAKLKQEVGARWLTVVEPSADMLAGAATNPLVDAAECKDANAWAKDAPSRKSGVPETYNCVLLKEVVHHFSTSERQSIFSLICSHRLDASDGRLLIVTRPQHNIDYPLWPAARDVWARNQPSETKLMDELRAAGFDKVECHLHAYPHAVKIEEWCRIVSGRFWSTFSHFTDEELLEGCAKIRADAQEPARQDAETLHFEDRLLLIVAATSSSEH